MGRTAIAALAFPLLHVSIVPAQDARWHIGGFDRDEDRFAESLAWIDDLDSDGVPEVAVAAGASSASVADDPLDPGIEDRVRILRGSDLVTMREIRGSWYTGFGASIVSCDDLDGDGRRDLFVGAPSAGEAGEAYVHSSASGRRLRTVSGESPHFRSGAALGCIGDVDGDGEGEFVIGAPDADRGAGPIGSVRVLSSMDHSLLAEWWGSEPGMGFGSSSNFDVVVDVDGDGIHDLAIVDAFTSRVAGEGARGTGPDNRFVLRVVSGANLATLLETTILEADHRRLGCVGSTADADGDGRGDLVLALEGSSWADDDALALVSGSDGSILRLLRMESSGFIRACDWIGDVDLDGLGDFAVAMQAIRTPDTYDVVLEVRSGASGAIIRPIYVGAGESSDPTVLATIGDRNPVDSDRDGWPDILYGFRSDVGYAAITSIKTGFRIASAHPRDEGLAIDRSAWVGDLDADHWPEAVGAEWSWRPTFDPRLQVVWRSGRNGTELSRVAVAAPFAFRSTRTVALDPVPDFDGDRIAETVVSSFDPDQPDSTVVDVISSIDGGVLRRFEARFSSHGNVVAVGVQSGSIHVAIGAPRDSHDGKLDAGRVTA